jgi:tellurium resistance protein TerD
MGVSLSKGQKVDLTKSNPGLTKVVVGLGWDTNKYDGGKEFDLDASAFLCKADGKSDAEGKDFVFYGAKVHPSGAVEHTGDNRTGAGDGDDEQIKIDLSKVPADIEKIDITVTIHEAVERNQNFGQVSNAFIRIFNEADNTELLKYDLGEDYSTETAVVFGQLYRNNGEWKFNAIGAGFAGGLAALCNNYGVNLN